MRNRDVGIVLVSLVAMYYSLQNEGSFTFQKGWSHMISESELDGLLASEALPQPVPADLNGDGRREVIIATRDAKLQVLSPPSMPSKTNDFVAAKVLTEVSLLPAKLRIATGRRPVALAVGFLDPQTYVQRSTLRKQVVVVVTASWTIMCFDHNLKILWEQNIQEHFPHHASVREVGIVITNHSEYTSDRGMVIVGGSIELGDVNQDPLDDPFAQERAAEERAKRHAHSATMRDHQERFQGGDDYKPDTSHHFSYYAFEGGKGTPLWKHEGQDFHRDAEQLAETLIPQHNYRLDANSLTQKHFGEVECREYRRSVMASMPHYWDRREDTVLQIAHFGKHRKPKSERPASAASVAATRSASSAAMAANTNKVVAAMEHAVKAATKSRHGKPSPTRRQKQTGFKYLPDNVVVAHLQEGLEAVQLYTGRTVCKLLLPQGIVHADINGDGVIDHVQAHGWHPQSPADGSVRIPRCWATATSGIGKEQLFNGSICRNNLGHESMSRAGSRGESSAPLEVTAPALMPAAESYLPGTRSFHARRRGAAYDVVFLNSRGEVTMYSAEGVKRWQLQAHTTWQRGGYDGEAHVVPALMTFAPRVGGRLEAILAVGAQLASVISATGTKLQKLTLQNIPVAPARMVDLNGDGLNDLLIPVQGGFCIYLQRAQSGALPFTALLGILIIAMSVVYFTQQQPGSSGNKPLRSTD